MEERLALQLRLATLTDASEIARLSAQLGYPVSDAEMDRRLEALLETPSRRCWVADPGDGLWGRATAELRLTLESGLRVEITGLVVDDKARRRGVGRLLVEQIEGWAKSGNCRVLGVSSNVLRAESHAFYESLGYVQTRTQHSYRKTLA